jgi:hypothetical protein
MDGAGETAGVHERSERVDFCLGNVIWCFRRRVRDGETIGGSETGCIAGCLGCPDRGAVLEGSEGTVTVVVVGYRNGMTTLVGGKPRRLRSAKDL